MKIICKLIGCNHKTCAYTQWIGNHFFQRFKCSRCDEMSPYWGHILEQTSFAQSKRRDLKHRPSITKGGQPIESIESYIG